MIANLRAEKAILYNMLFAGEECSTRALASLRPEDFAEPRHGALFAACARCASKGEINRITIESYTQDVETLCSLDWEPPSLIESYIEAVQEAARRRACVAKARNAIGAAEGNDPAYINLMQDAVTAAQAGSGTVEPVGGKALAALLTLHDERRTVLKTGFPELDYFMRGLNKRELIVIAARPSVGKTSLGVNIALNVAGRGVPTVIFSLETDETTLLRRAAYTLSEVSEERTLRGRDDDPKRGTDAAEKLGNMPLYINDRTGITPEEIVTYCYKVKRSAGSLGLIVIDYLQLITGRQSKNGTRERDVAEISRRMKTLASEMNVPVILISQVGRDIEKRTDKTPQLSDLRESGAIEQDADIVLFVGGTEEEPEKDGAVKREIVIAKNRNGKKGKIALMWRGDIFRFYNPKECREIAELSPFVER